jgi:hypothetical protein
MTKRQSVVEAGDPPSIGPLRRKCLAKLIVLHERHLLGLRRNHIDFHRRWRGHPPL